MSEPIRTVAELGRVFGQAAWNGGNAHRGILLTKHDAIYEEGARLRAMLAAGQANRILDYLGLDYCGAGETPRECIEREREAADDAADVRGALLDAGNISVGGETSLADGVRQLTAERDRYRDALVRVAQLWRAALPRPKGGQQAGVQHYVINSETSRELQRLLIAAGLDPDTLGVE